MSEVEARTLLRTEEVAIINAFVVPTRRERMIELLGNPKRRRKILNDLAHFRPNLLPEHLFEIPFDVQTSEELERFLKTNGAPSLCFVISENALLDGRRMGISEALEETLGSGMGTIISCIPGRLAYFEGETPGERYLLKK